MTKYFLMSLCLMVFNQVTAQIRLEKIGSHAHRSIQIGANVELTFPTKTNKPECNCFQMYGGILKTSSKDGVELELSFMQRLSVDENNVGFEELKYIKQPKNPMTTQIPLTKIQSIARMKSDVRELHKFAAVLIFLSLIDNLFIAPHVDTPIGKTFRNAGYIGMTAGLVLAFIPEKKTYYLEQPKSGNKSLWKIVN